jgi:hypothetical protein
VFFEGARVEAALPTDKSLVPLRVDELPAMMMVMMLVELRDFLLYVIQSNVDDGGW